jgi:mannose-6-phosphate isomerase-like protein (cupin superfamily)
MTDNGLRVRRVVTGTDEHGRAAVITDGIAPRHHDFATIPGMSETLVWSTPAPCVLDPRPTDPTPGATSLVAAPGESQLKIVIFPPDAVFADPSFDPVAADAEQAVAQPGLAALFEPDAPGMHMTQTVDYALVLDGAITLELDAGETVELRRGDVAIQNGTRHAWRNPTGVPATVAFFVVGAQASAGST